MIVAFEIPTSGRWVGPHQQRTNSISIVHRWRANFDPDCGYLCLHSLAARTKCARLHCSISCCPKRPGLGQLRTDCTRGSSVEDQIDS